MPESKDEAQQRLPEGGAADRQVPPGTPATLSREEIERYLAGRGNQSQATAFGADSPRNRRRNRQLATAPRVAASDIRPEFKRNQNAPETDPRYVPPRRSRIRQIAFYGKGGIGKSTTCQNVAAPRADRGRRVLVVGCDPKADSTRLLMGGRLPETVLDAVRRQQEGLGPNGVLIHDSPWNIRCVESGGPEPGVGCAGRGIITAISYLEQAGVYEEDLDYCFYDVLGDVVCGGFAMPIREGKADRIYMVVSGEMMALYAANNIAQGIRKFAHTSGTRLAGIICNSREVRNEQELVAHFATRIGCPWTSFIPRAHIVQEAEVQNRTVIAHAPDSEQAAVYRELARRIDRNPTAVIPTPAEFHEIETMMRRFLVRDKQPPAAGGAGET